MKNTIIIDGFTWVQVPVEIIEFLDCEVYTLNDDGSESLVERGSYYDDLTYVIEPNTPAIAAAWLNMHDYDATLIGGNVVLRVVNDSDEVLHVEISEFTINEIAERVGI
jgi:hypothetical protein